MSNIRYAPFIHSSGTASYMNASMLIALLPCAAYAVFRYGLRALILILLSGILACGVKYIFDLLRKKSKQPDINPIGRDICSYASARYFSDDRIRRYRLYDSDSL